MKWYVTNVHIFVLITLILVLISYFCVKQAKTINQQISYSFLYETSLCQSTKPELQLFTSRLLNGEQSNAGEKIIVIYTFL